MALTLPMALFIEMLPLMWTVADFWAAPGLGKVWEGSLCDGRNQEGG